MSKIIVTGIGGFIGSCLAKKLIENGYEVIGIDDFSTGLRTSIPKEATLIEGDCSKDEALTKINFDGVDAIYHIAGQSSGEISFDDPLRDLQSNTSSTLSLLNLARQYKINKFIYASTVSVYGEPENNPVTEQTITLPKSFYAVGKTASEHYCRLYSKYGITTTCLRLFNVYGPGQNLNNLRQGMVSIYLAQAIKDKIIKVKGTSSRYRDQIYIDDVVNAFLSAGHITNGKNNCFNVSTGIKTTVETVLQTILKHLPFKVEVVFLPGTPGDVDGVFGENQLAIEKLGWKPQVSFDQGIKKMINWALKNG